MERLSLFSMTLLLGLAPTASLAQQRIEITIPEDPSLPPQAKPDVLRVSPGKEFEILHIKGGRAQVFFKDGRTPVLDTATRRPLEQREVSRGGAVWLTAAEHCDDKGCEYRYGVRDLDHPGRPVLDPIIIIE